MSGDVGSGGDVLDSEEEALLKRVPMENTDTAPFHVDTQVLADGMLKAKLEDEKPIYGPCNEVPLELSEDEDWGWVQGKYELYNYIHFIVLAFAN